MKFLITGITSFVAPHLAKILIKDKHEVYGMYRGESPIDDISDTLDYGDQIFLEKGDLTNEDSIKNIIEKIKPDGIFHIGAFAHPPSSFLYPDLCFRTNALGTIYICEAIKKYYPECILMQCSTPEVYGICPSDKKIDETFPMKPMNPYGVSKASADMYILEQTRNVKLKAFITRAFSHTGARRKPNFSIASDAIQIAKIIKGKQEPIIKVGNLKAQRVVADVRDIVDVYYKLMLEYKKNKIENGSIFHIAGNELHDMGYYLDIMLNIFNLKVQLEIDKNLYRPIDIPIQIPDDSKVRKLLNWKPTIPIEMTLKNLVEYWLKKI